MNATVTHAIKLVAQGTKLQLKNEQENFTRHVHAPKFNIAHLEFVHVYRNLLKLKKLFYSS